LFIE
jgi:large subunit ribosomal protein L17e